MKIFLAFAIMWCINFNALAQPVIKNKPKNTAPVNKNFGVANKNFKKYKFVVRDLENADNKKKIVNYFDSGELIENRARVVINYKYGYIDSMGNEVIPLQFDYADVFSEGLAVVQVGQKYGYIDTTGKVVIQTIIDEAGPFHNGEALIRIENDVYYIDKSGNFIRYFP